MFLPAHGMTRLVLMLLMLLVTQETFQRSCGYVIGERPSQVKKRSLLSKQGGDRKVIARILTAVTCDGSDSNVMALRCAARVCGEVEAYVVNLCQLIVAKGRVRDKIGYLCPKEENVRWPSGSTECFSHTTTRGRQFDTRGKRGGTGLAKKPLRQVGYGQY
ncbi:hypothetical protein F2Q69_00029981 [Brassica cretica]|uniref:Secreted protein n=1 Tax=Brassica cretica TaxID=69181 RepID=A0A8S9S4P9_BRACR|nr:hypothetical protein F2Q69_00029981 [Brassica cretica]